MNANGNGHSTLLALIQSISDDVKRMSQRLDALSDAVGASVPLLEAMSRLQTSESNLVKEAVEAVFKMPKGQTELPTRQEHIVWPRQIAMYVMRERLNMTLTNIGNVYRKDHGTVISACERVKGRIQTNARDRAAVETVQHLLDAALKGRYK